MGSPAVRDPTYAACQLSRLSDIRAEYPENALIIGLLCDTSAPGAAAIAWQGDLQGVIARKPQTILYLDPADRWIDAPFVAAQQARWPHSVPAINLCVPYLPAPRLDIRYDGNVRSFMCSPAIFVEAAHQHHAHQGRGSLAFWAVQVALRGEQPAAIYVGVEPNSANRDTTLPELGSLPAARKNVAIITAHRGDLDRLRSCLRIASAAFRGAQMLVGFDEAVTPVHLNIAESFPETEFFSVDPAHVGLFVIRQFLIELCQTEFILLQDSDDAPCRDRLAAMCEAAVSGGADSIGCHELRIDEFNLDLRIFRFPLDANAALDQGWNYAQFHSTALLRRSAFLRAGGYSTRRRFSSDGEFTLRAHFSTRLMNVDKFLYLRVFRPGSLMTSPQTGASSRFRVLFRRIRRRDFEAIGKGEMTLAESSLTPRHLYGRTYEFRNLRTHEVHVFCPSRHATETRAP